MFNIMEYKGYYTYVQYDKEDNFYHGKLEGIQDLVNFGSENINELEQEFHSAVDDYLSFCEEEGRLPQVAKFQKVYVPVSYNSTSAVAF